MENVLRTRQDSNGTKSYAIVDKFVPPDFTKKVSGVKSMAQSRLSRSFPQVLKDVEGLHNDGKLAYGDTRERILSLLTIHRHQTWETRWWTIGKQC